MDSKTKSDTNVKTNNSVTSKSNVSEQYDWEKAINEQSITNKDDTHLDKSLNIPFTDSNRIQLLPIIDDGETSIITRGTTASTNLTAINDNDDQSKLINEQLKRSSLGLARDSLELLHDTTPHHANEDEQIILPMDILSSSHPRKSVLKSHSNSSDHLPTSNLISYVAIDEVQGDKHLLENHIRYDRGKNPMDKQFSLFLDVVLLPWVMVEQLFLV